MGMDRNTVIGFILIGALLIGMFVINSRSRLAYEGEQKRIADSIEKLKPKVDTSLAVINTKISDSTKIIDSSSAETVIPVKQTSLENDLVKIIFSNKGAQPVFVELKKFKKLNGDTVILQNGGFNEISYAYNSGQNQTSQSSDVIFKGGEVVKNADNSQSISFYIGDSVDKKIVHTIT